MLFPSPSSSSTDADGVGHPSLFPQSTADERASAAEANTWGEGGMETSDSSCEPVEVPVESCSHGLHPVGFLREVMGLASEEKTQLIPPMIMYNGEGDRFLNGGSRRCSKSFEEILQAGAQSGLICREVPIKETRHAIRSEISK